MGGERSGRYLHCCAALPEDFLAFEEHFMYISLVGRLTSLQVGRTGSKELLPPSVITVNSLLSSVIGH